MKTQEISRLDRIEKNVELFFKGMVELRESQKQTDKQISELRESQKQTDKQISELRGSQKQTDEQQRRTDEQQNKTERLLQRTIKKLDEVGRQLGDLGLVQGEVAEDIFYRNVKYLFKPRGKTYGIVKRNLKCKGFAEYDIVALENKEVLVIEVKNKLGPRMVDNFINKKLPKFKTAFPEYKDYTLSAGIGALVVKDEVGRYAEDSGLYVLTQTDEGGAALINKRNFKPKIFH